MGKPIQEIAKEKGLTPAELGRIGGSKPKKKRKFTVMKNRNCTSKCPIFHRCFYNSVSKNYNGKCGLAHTQNLDESGRYRFLATLIGNREELENAIRTLITELEIKAQAEGSVSSLNSLLDAMMKLHKMQYGDKRTIDQTTTHKGMISVDEFVTAFHEAKERQMSKSKDSKGEEKPKP